MVKLLVLRWWRRGGGALARRRRSAADIRQQMQVGGLVEQGAAVKLERQARIHRVVAAAETEIAPETLQRIAQCKPGWPGNIHQPFAGPAQQVHCMAAVGLNLGLVEAAEGAHRRNFIESCSGAADMQPR